MYLLLDFNHIFNALRLTPNMTGNKIRDYTVENILTIGEKNYKEISLYNYWLVMGTDTCLHGSTATVKCYYCGKEGGLSGNVPSSVFHSKVVEVYKK